MITRETYLVSDNVNELYYEMCKDLYTNGKRVNGTVELENVKVVLTNPCNNIITLRERKTSKKYLLAENIWYAAGSNLLNFIGTFASLWQRITDDGLTNNSAYGYIMKYKHGFNQIEKVIEILTKTPDNRRAIININDANADVLETKDEQCTMFLQFLIRDNKLNMTAAMRSNDLIYGFVNDIAAFTALQQYIAHRLNIEVGTYTHFASSLHYYNTKDNNSEQMVKNIINAGIDAVNKPYSIDWVKLYKNAELLYNLVDNDKDNIITICREHEVLIDGK